MLKYIAISGVALSAVFVLSEIGINLFGNMLKTKRETGVSVKNQLVMVIKDRQG